jgi:ribosomal protein L40E
VAKKCPLCGTVYESDAQKYCLKKHCKKCGSADIEDKVYSYWNIFLIFLPIIFISLGLALYLSYIVNLINPQSETSFGIICLGFVISIIFAYITRGRCFNCGRDLYTPDDLKTDVELVPLIKKPKIEIEKCKKCGAIVPKEGTYCGKCGTKLGAGLSQLERKLLRCVKCGAVMPRTAKFCGKCGRNFAKHNN